MALPGTIAITDFDWYSYLSQQRSWDEVNFWKPTTTQPFRAPEFSPFFFKLKAPHRAIAGFGYFARYSELPEWLAWECFGTANGSASFEEMHARLEKIRAKIKAAPQKGILQIGCIVVVNATFFSRDEWIPQPRDWANRIFVTLYTTWTLEKEREFGRNAWREFSLIVNCALQNPVAANRSVTVLPF